MTPLPPIRGLEPTAASGRDPLAVPSSVAPRRWLRAIVSRVSASGR